MKFYQKNWFMWLMLIFVTPVGLFLMWRNNKFNKVFRIVFTCIFSFWFLICCIAYGNGEEPIKQISSNGPTIQDTSGNENITATPTENTTTTPSGNQNPTVSGHLKVHFIDVGQADSILLQQGNNYMLVDAGNNADDDTVKDYLAKQGVTELKYFIGTHKDEDHIGSADYIINSFKVDKVYFPKQTATTETFKDFVTVVQNKGLKLTVPKVGEQFSLGDANITVLAPNGSSYSDSNDYSIVVKVTYGNTSFLLTGDAETQSEEEMVSSGRDLSANVLKVGHHGSGTSTGQAFLNKVNPKYAVISVGVDNKYKHPSQDTLNRLRDKGIKVYRTDEQGTIIATSDGTNITFDKSQGSYNGIASSAASTPVPTLKPTVAPTIAQTTAPVANFSASIDNPTPKQNATINLSVNGPGGTFDAVCHYKSKNTTYTGNVNSPIKIDIGRAALDYEVKIDITITYNNKTYTTSASFTPKQQ